MAVNLTRWYACFFSKRFWQFFAINFLLDIADDFIQLDISYGSEQYDLIMQMVVALITGILITYTKVKFKYLLGIFIFLKFIICLFFLFKIEQLRYILSIIS